MANDNTTEQLKLQLELAQKLTEIYKTNTDQAEAFRQAQAEIKDLLEEQYGKQLEYMTSVEKEAIERQNTIDAQQSLLDIAEEYNALKAAANDRDVKLNATESLRLKQLEKINGQSEKNLEYSEDELKAAREKLKIQREELQVIEKKEKALKKAGDQLETQLQSMFGIQTSAKNFSQELFLAGKEGGTFAEKMDLIRKRMKSTFSAENIALTAMGKIADQGAKFRESFSPTGIRTQYQELNKTFVQTSGLTQKLGNDIKNLQTDLIENTSVVEGESSPAINALIEGFVDFTRIGNDARSELIETTARMARLGVDVSQTTGIIDKFSKGMGKSTTAATKITKEMFKFSRAIGVGPNRMLGQLNKNFDLVAKFGEKKGVEVFKKLAITAKATGVEFDKLLGITKAFDTFESAAESAGKLNFLLGGPLLNSTELLAASEDERIEMVQKALQQSGKSFDQLGRFAKEAIASTLQVDVSELGKLMDPSNAAAAESLAAGIDTQTKAMGSLKKESDDVITRQQQQRINLEKEAVAMKEVTGAIHNMLTEFDKLMEKYAPFLAVLGMFAPLINGMIALMSSAATAGVTLSKVGAGIAKIFTGIAKVFGFVLKAAGFLFKGLILGIRAVGAAFLTNPIGLAITAITVVIALLYTYWDEVSSFFMESISAIGDAFSSVWDAIKDGWDFAVEKIREGLNFLMDFFKTAANFIGSALIEAMFAFPTAIAMGFDWIAGKIGQGINFLIGKIPKKIRSMIGVEMVSEEGLGLTNMIGGYKNSIYEMTGVTPAFAEGTESAPGGMSLVGEEGPELVNLPGRTQVIPADQTREMMSTLERFNKITSRGANTGTPAPAMGGAQELNQTIVLQLDGEVLAKHTSKVTVDTLEQVLRPRSYS